MLIKSNVCVFVNNVVPTYDDYLPWIIDLCIEILTTPPNTSTTILKSEVFLSVDTLCLDFPVLLFCVTDCSGYCKQVFSANNIYIMVERELFKKWEPYSVSMCNILRVRKNVCR